MHMEIRFMISTIHNNNFYHLLVQPDYSVQIQMVRRLVQHEQRWLHKQSPSQGDSHTPATREILSGPLLHFPTEAETGKDTTSTRLSRVCVDST